MLFYWYQSYHWYQWRPFLSPLTPMESICEYWATLAREQAVYGQIARESSYPKLCGRKIVKSPKILFQVTGNADFCRLKGYHVQQHPDIPTTHSSGLFHLIKDKGRYLLPDVLLIYLAFFISSRHKERDVLHILIYRLFRLIIA